MTRLVREMLRETSLYKFLASIRPPAKVKDRLRTQGAYIEFVGPAGIGKSTILTEIKSNTVGDWHYREELPGLKLRYGSEALDGQLHWRLLYAKAGNLEERELNGFRKMELMRYFTNIALSDIKIFNSKTERGFWLDEGLCHNFSREFNDFSDDDFKMIMSGRALIVMMPKDSMTVVERIRKREKDTGRMVTHHIGLNNDELKALAEASIASLEKLTRRAATLGVPMCEIFAEDNLMFNTDSVLKFERDLLSRFQQKTNSFNEITI